MRQRPAACIVAALSLVGPGCERRDQTHEAAPVVSPSGRARASDASSPLAGLEIVWDVPHGWRADARANPMRLATYWIPKARGDSEDAELGVFYFGPGQGGTVDANVERWIGQFEGVVREDVKREDRNVNGLRQHTVEVPKGTYRSGMPGGPKKPKPGYGLLGAIVQAPSGSFFFKLTGPIPTVRAARSAFYELLDSVRLRS